MHVESMRRDRVLQMLRECGYHVVAVKNMKATMTALSTKGIEWAMVILDFKCTPHLLFTAPYPTLLYATLSQPS